MTVRYLTPGDVAAVATLALRAGWALDAEALSCLLEDYSTVGLLWDDPLTGVPCGSLVYRRHLVRLQILALVGIPAALEDLLRALQFRCRAPRYLINTRVPADDYLGQRWLCAHGFRLGFTQRATADRGAVYDYHWRRPPDALPVRSSTEDGCDLSSPPF